MPRVPDIDHTEQDLLRLDVDLLVRQYRNRHSNPLTREQRQAWAAEAADLLEALISVTRGPDESLARDRFLQVVLRWNADMAAGTRPVTAKT
jgi:aminoglycoside/choline kinase family phosphotransferase